MSEDEVGSVAEEAAKLIGALSGWAREHGADQWEGVAGAAHNVNEHLATGSEDCTFCPVCRGVHLVRSASPEVKAHLTSAAASLLQAAASLMAAHVPGPGDAAQRSSTVEHIDLDDEAAWPAEEGDES